MSLPTNNKKGDSKKSGMLKNQSGGSKFIKSAASKPASAVKKVRSTGANRGS